MSIQGTITQKDYVAAQFLNMRPRAALAILGVLLLVIIFGVGIVIRDLKIIGCLILIISYFALFVPYMAKRNFRSCKAHSELLKMEIREDGLFFFGKNVQVLLPWAHILKWRKNNRMALLYPANNIFHILPSHLFGSEDNFQQFISILETRLGKAT